VIELRFEASLGGAVVGVQAKAKVVYSSYLGPGQFRVGATFVTLDPASAAAIDALLA